MNDSKEKIKEIIEAIEIIKNNFLNSIKEKNSSIHVYTHLDADGLSSGAILGKALFRENIPFQITVLRQLEKEEIEKISENIKKFKHFLIFSDFGSGQYLELQNQLISKENFNSFIILDHHLPQNVSSKEDIDLIITNIPRLSKQVSKERITKLYKEFFYQADYILKKDGKIIICCKDYELLKQTAEKFKVVNEREIEHGKEVLKIIVFSH